jgi:hypothetical protein
VQSLTKRFLTMGEICVASEMIRPADPQRIILTRTCNIIVRGPERKCIDLEGRQGVVVAGGLGPAIAGGLARA